MKRRVFYSIVAAVVLIPAGLTLLPVGTRTAVYRSVNSRGEAHDDLVVLTVPRFRTPSRHVIDHSTLHLLVQDHRHALVLTTMIGSVPRWNERAIQQYRQAHPELEQYWPKPAEAAAGVAWIDRGSASP